MTTGEMIALCGTRVGHPNISVTLRAQILAELNQALRFLCHDAWDWRRNSVTYAVTGATTEIPIGSTYDGIIRVAWGNEGYELPPRSSLLESIENLHPSYRQRGTPACWDAYYKANDAYLVLLPYPATAGTVYVRALYGFRPVSADADVPLGIPEQWQDFIVDRASARLSVISGCDKEVGKMLWADAQVTYQQMKGKCSLVQAPIRAIPFLPGQFGN